MIEDEWFPLNHGAPELVVSTVTKNSGRMKTEEIRYEQG